MKKTMQMWLNDLHHIVYLLTNRLIYVTILTFFLTNFALQLHTLLLIPNIETLHCSIQLTVERFMPITKVCRQLMIKINLKKVPSIIIQ